MPRRALARGPVTATAWRRQSTPATRPRRRSPLLRLLRLARPTARAGCCSPSPPAPPPTGCGVALMAASGFLLSRASQHPNIVALSIAIVAVRALGISRGRFRYVERLGAP